MKRFSVLGGGLLLVACKTPVDIGEGAPTGSGGSATQGATTSMVSTTAATTSVATTSVTTGSGSQTSTSSTGLGTSTSSGGVTCNNLPGYPNIPGVYADIAGGDIQGTWQYSATVSAGTADSSWGPPYEGNWLAFGMGTSVTEEFFLWIAGVAKPTVGTAYPLSANFVIGPNSPAMDSRDPNNPMHWYNYPPSGGPGTCTIKYDELIVGTNSECVRATFSCSGLVGSSTGQAITVTNGFVVVGAGTSGP